VDLSVAIGISGHFMAFYGLAGEGVHAGWRPREKC
jgi:hypothetical protein